MIIIRCGFKGFARVVLWFRRCARMSENGNVGPTYSLSKIIFAFKYSFQFVCNIGFLIRFLRKFN